MPVKKLDLDLIPQLRSKEMQAKRKVLARTLEGNWSALLKGRGMEFAGFRKYTYGDDASRIDWGASLRAHDTLIRELEEYKNVHVVFLIDTSNSMLFTSTHKLKAEYAAEMSFNLAAAILDNGDAIGYAMFSDKILAHGDPQIGTEAIYAFASALSDPKNYGGKRNFRNVAIMLNAMLKQKALIVLVSDFIGYNEGWEHFIKMLSERFDLIGIMIRDARDYELPTKGGQFLVEDPYSNEHLLVDTADYHQLYAEAVNEDIAYITGVFTASRAGLITVRTDGDLLRPILGYLRHRNKMSRG